LPFPGAARHSRPLMYTQSLDLTTCLSFESCDSGNAAGGVGLMISYIAVYISYDFGNLPDSQSVSRHERQSASMGGERDVRTLYISNGLVGTAGMLLGKLECARVLTFTFRR